MNNNRTAIFLSWLEEKRKEGREGRGREKKEGKTIIHLDIAGHACKLSPLGG